MYLQSLLELVTYVSELFVWVFRNVINTIDTKFCWFPVFDHDKLFILSYLKLIECMKLN